jgi:hypothetical protein
LESPGLRAPCQRPSDAACRALRRVRFEPPCCSLVYEPGGGVGPRWRGPPDAAERSGAGHSPAGFPRCRLHLGRAEARRRGAGKHGRPRAHRPGRYRPG